MKIRRVIEVVTTSRTRNAVYRYGIKSSNLLLSANTQNPAFLQGFLVLTESKERTLQFACPRALPEETRHFHPVECAVISYSLSYKPIPCIFAGFFVRWQRVRKELFSSRVGSADIRRGAPALAGETALSLTLNTQNLSPAFLQGFLVLAESKERTLQFACPRALPEETRHFHPVECAVISYSLSYKPISA